MGRPGKVGLAIFRGCTVAFVPAQTVSNIDQAEPEPIRQ